MPELASIENQNHRFSTHIPDDVLTALANIEEPDELQALIQILHTEKVALPEIGEATYTIALIYDERGTIIDFQFANQDELIGTLQFQDRENHAFKLTHRYVEPELRGKGVGNHLLIRAEATLQALANTQKQNVYITADFGQMHVVDWFVNRGYTFIGQESLDAYNDITEHPEKYIIRDFVGEYDTLLRERCVYPIGTTDFAIENTVRIKLSKTIEPNLTKT